MAEQQKLYKLLSYSMCNWYDDENPNKIDFTTHITILGCDSDEKLKITVFNNNSDVGTTFDIPIPDLIKKKDKCYREYYVDELEIQIKEVNIDKEYITIIIEITNHKTYLTEKISCRFRSRTLQEYKHENSSSE
jgi:hypothetical protein